MLARVDCQSAMALVDDACETTPSAQVPLAYLQTCRYSITRTTRSIKAPANAAAQYTNKIAMVT